jgi:UDP-glucose 4-epimerase
MSETVFGDLPEDCNLDGDEAPFSTAKVREELGWVPEHSWRTAESEEPGQPAFLRG